jgi:TonB family protein
MRLHPAHTVVVMWLTFVPAIAALLWSDNVMKERIKQYQDEAESLRALRTDNNVLRAALQELQAAVEREKLLRVSAEVKVMTAEGSRCTAETKPAHVNATVNVQNPIAFGSLDNAIIRRITQEHIAQARACYERELLRSPGLEGRVDVKYVINGDGHVTQAQIADASMKNEHLEKCLSLTTKSWVFPKPKGGGNVIVQQRYIFELAQ